jgi:hypothetical protein
MRRILGVIMATVILLAAGCSSGQTDQETQKCMALRASFDDAKQRWTTHPHSKDAKANFQRVQADLLASGCLKS